MDLEALKNKPLCLVVWNTEKEDDVQVYLGKLRFEKGKFFFINPDKGWRVSLNEELLSRIKPVEEKLKKTLLQADFALSLRMGQLPGDDLAGFEETGMKWEQ